MTATRNDIEIYFPHAEVYEDNRGFTWGIPDYIGGSGAVEWIKEPAYKHGAHHATKEQARAAALAYCWSQPKMVREATEVAVEAAKYQAAQRRKALDAHQ